LGIISTNCVQTDKFEIPGIVFSYDQQFCLETVTFPQKEAFESFTEFFKTLENISELELDITTDQRERQSNNYCEILMHLLKIKTLTKLSLFCEDIGNLISRWWVHNPAVKMLDTNQLSVIRYFPNIQQLHIKNTVLHVNENFTQATCISSLTEIKIDDITYRDLPLIKCPRLKKFTTKKVWDYQRDSTVFQMFAQNNPEIEELELFRYQAPLLPAVPERDNRQVIDAKDVAHLITNLPKLSIFKMSGAKLSNTLKFAGLVGETFRKLQLFEFGLKKGEASEVNEYFKLKLPLYKTAVKNHDNYCKVLTVEKI
jgi:hypothetical protein